MRSSLSFVIIFCLCYSIISLVFADEAADVQILRGREWVNENIILRPSGSQLFVAFQNFENPGATPVFEEVAAVEKVSLKPLQLLQLQNPPINPANPNGNQPYPNANGNQPYPNPNGNQPYPNNNQPNPNGNQPYPNTNQPYPNGNQPYPNTNQPYPNTNQPYPNTNQPYPNTNQPYPNTNQPYPNTNQQYTNQPYANQPYPNTNLRFHEVETQGGSAGTKAEDVALIEKEMKEMREEVQATDELKWSIPELSFTLVGDDTIYYMKFVDNTPAATFIFTAFTAVAQRTTLEQQYFVYAAVAKQIWAAYKTKYPFLVSSGVRYTIDVSTVNQTVKGWFIGIDLLWNQTTYPTVDYVKTRDTFINDVHQLLTFTVVPPQNLLVQWVSDGDPLINNNNFRKDSQNVRFDPFIYGGASNPPMVGGVNTGFKSPKSGLGTIGGFLIRHPAVLSNDVFDLYAVSNAHVWRGKHGTDACQPSEALYRADAPTGLGFRSCQGVTPAADTCCQRLGPISSRRANLPHSRNNNVFNLSTINNGLPVTHPATFSQPTATTPNTNNYDPTKFVRDFAVVKVDLENRYRFRCAIRDIGVITGVAKHAGYHSRNGVANFDGVNFEFHEPAKTPTNLLSYDLLKYGSRTHLTGGRIQDYFPRSQLADFTIVGRRSSANPHAMPINFDPQTLFTDPNFAGSIIPNGDFQFISNVRDHFVANAPMPLLSLDPVVHASNKSSLFNELWKNGRILSAFAFVGDSGAFVTVASQVIAQLHEAVWVAARPDSDLGLAGKGLDSVFPCFKGACPPFGSTSTRTTASGAVLEFAGFYLKIRAMSINFVVDELNAELKATEGSNWAPIKVCTEPDRLGYVVGRPASVCQVTGTTAHPRCGPRPLCHWNTAPNSPPGSTGSCVLRTDL